MGGMESSVSADAMSNDPRSTIFLSYARADRERVASITLALEEAGHNVWWDTLIEGGAAFAKTIEAALENADVVVVAWSKTSIESDWVRDEASRGRDRGRLVPISLDGTQPPLGFRQYHFVDLSHWNGDSNAKEIGQLQRAIAAIQHGPTPSPAPRITNTAVIPTSSRRRVLTFAGGATLVALTGGVVAWQRGLFSAGETTPDNSIAVLPFTNLSGDPAQSYFSDGLAAELRATLARSNLFRVAAQTSSNMFRDHKANAKDMASKLSVAYLLDGSVRRAGNVVRIATELVEARSGFSRWSQTFDRKMSDIFAIEDEIAATVAHAISGQMPGAKPKPLPPTAGTTNVLAYEAYLRGKALFNLDIDESTERQALAQFDMAIAADSRYAAAYAARSRALAIIAGQYTKADQLHHMFDSAIQAAQKAVSLAPDLDEAQAALGYAIYTGNLDFRAARPAYDRAYALGLGNADILLLFAFFASKAGRGAEALQAVDRALLLDPLNPRVYRAKGRILYAMRRYQEAIPPLQQSLTMSPKISTSHATIGNALLMLGRLDEARAAYLAEPHKDVQSVGLAIISHRQGNSQAAQAAFDTLLAGYGDSAAYQQAQILAQWGKNDLAIAALEKARAVGDDGITLLRNDPMLDPVRTDPRFKRLLAALGLA